MNCKRIDLASALLVLCLSLFVAGNETTRTPHVSTRQASAPVPLKGFPSPINVATRGAQLLVDNKPFFIKGVCYSPAPLGSNPLFTSPFGDYFTAIYAPLWLRDFPMMKSMGVNTIRLYGWNTTSPATDHLLFLNTAHEYGLKVIVTFYLGTAEEHPVLTDVMRNSVANGFAHEVGKYAGHPAILAWSFGNEINGDWNSFLQQFDEAFHCGMNFGSYPATPGGCVGYALGLGPCATAIACVYSNTFKWIDQAAQNAHHAVRVALYGENGAVSSSNGHHLIITSFADVDQLELRIANFESMAPHVDAWGAQIYRGRTFGEGSHDFISRFEVGSWKPLIVTEFGVDAYSDPCGDIESERGRNMKACYNDASRPPPGYGEDEVTQADWVANLARILLDHSSAELAPPNESVLEASLSSIELGDASQSKNQLLRPKQKKYLQDMRHALGRRKAGSEKKEIGETQNSLTIPAEAKASPVANPQMVTKNESAATIPVPVAKRPLSLPLLRGSVAGGCIMAWMDERWKSSGPLVKGCGPQVFPSNRFDSSKCEWKAHVNCPAVDPGSDALCGYWLMSAPDHYVNEGWFGIVRPVRQGSGWLFGSATSMQAPPPLLAPGGIDPFSAAAGARGFNRVPVTGALDKDRTSGMLPYVTYELQMKIRNARYFPNSAPDTIVPRLSYAKLQSLWSDKSHTNTSQDTWFAMATAVVACAIAAVLWLVGQNLCCPLCCQGGASVGDDVGLENGESGAGLNISSVGPTNLGSSQGNADKINKGLQHKEVAGLGLSSYQQQQWPASAPGPTRQFANSKGSLNGAR